LPVSAGIDAAGKVGAMIDSDESADVAKTLAWYRSSFFEGCEEGFVADFMVFCWQTLDAGNVAATDLRGDLFDACAGQLRELLQSVEETCGPWSAPAFWKRYIEWADYATLFSIEDQREFAQHDPGYIEPAFSVFAFTGGQEMRAEAMTVLAGCAASSTMRASYVRSVIESRLRVEAFAARTR